MSYRTSAWRLLIVALLCAPRVSSAAVKVDSNDDGSFAAEGFRFELLLQKGKTVAAASEVKAVEGFPKRDVEGYHYRGTADFGGAVVTFDETIRPSADGESIAVTLNADHPIECDTAALVARLPADKYAGESLTYNGGLSALPTEPGDTVLLWKAGIKAIGVPLLDEKKQNLYIGGTLTSCVADQRKWNDPAFGLRLLLKRDAASDQATFTKAGLTFTLSLNAQQAAADVLQTGLPTDLDAWTAPHWNTSARAIRSDQGTPAIEVHTKQRDWNQYLTYRLMYPRDVARCVFTGRLRTSGVSGGAAPIEAARAQLVYRNAAGEQIGGWPSSTTQGGTIDWTPFTQDHTDLPAGVRFIDVCIGLYVSTGTATYDQLNVSAYDTSGNVIERIAVPADERTDTSTWHAVDTGRENKDRPLAIDFSRFIPKPAGQFGKVTVKDGHFAFADSGQRVRFWGVGWDHRGRPEQNEAVAARLAATGVNLVRFHTLDGPFLDRAIWQNPKADTQTLNPAVVDQFDNLVAALKRNGIYIDINLLAYRPFAAADGVKDADQLTGGGGVAAMFDPTLIELQKQYARQLLDRVNPYTGLKYADEPALAMIEIKNETSFHLMDFMGGVPQSYRDDLNRRFVDWLGKRRAPSPKERFETLIRTHDPYATAFSVQLTRDYFRTMRSFLRDEIGIKCPIAGTQALGWDVDDLSAASAECDYIDTHGYWDHPSGGWDPLSLYKNTSILRSGDSNFLAEASACRVAGKPFTMSEWNFCWPNEFISEGPLTVATIALRNDWDAAMVFGFDGTGFAPRMESTFKADNKPQFALPYEVAALAFHRRDITASAPSIAAVSPDHAIGAAKTFFPATEFKLSNPSLNFGNFQSTVAVPEQSPVTWDSRAGQLIVDTPCLQAVVGNCAEQISTADVRFACGMSFAQVSVTSLDDRPISSSGHLLLCATARAENSGERYRLFRKGLTSLGNGPILMEPVSGSVVLTARTKPMISVLDLYGRKTGASVDAVQADGKWTVPLSTAANGLLEIQLSP